MDHSNLVFNFPLIGPQQTDLDAKPTRTVGSYIYCSLIAGTAIEVILVGAVAALLSWLLTLLEKEFPDIFPFQTDFAVILLLITLTILFFDVRLQHEYYLVVLQHLNLITNALRRLVKTGKLPIEQANDLLRVVKVGVLSKPDHQITVAFEGVESEDLARAAQVLETHLHLLERGPLSILSQVTIYLLAFALPWFYFGYFFDFVILIVPLVLLPLLALRQYGCKLRYKGRQWHETDPFWRDLTEKLNFTLENPPLKP